MEITETVNEYVNINVYKWEVKQIDITNTNDE